MSGSWWFPRTGRVEHDFSSHHLVPEMVAGTGWMDAILGKEDPGFLSERVCRISREQIDEFDVMGMSGLAENISLSEGAAAEITAEPAGKQGGGSDIAVPEQDDVLCRNTVRPIKYD